MRGLLAGGLLVVTAAAWGAAPPARLSEGERAALVRAAALNGEGVALIGKVRHREAARPLREALSICLKVLGERHPFTAACYNNLGNSLDLFSAPRCLIKARSRLGGTGVLPRPA
jgi:hypothetical protein